MCSPKQLSHELAAVPGGKNLNIDAHYFSPPIIPYGRILYVFPFFRRRLFS